MANDENNEREIGKKKKECAGVITLASFFFIFHPYVIGNPLESMIPLWV